MKKYYKLICTATIFIILVGFYNQVYANDIIRVGLLRLNYNQASITVSTTNIEIGRGDADGSFTYNRTLHSPTGFVVQVEGGQVTIRAGGQLLFTFLSDVADSAQIRAVGGGTVTIGNYTYRGVIEFHPSGGRVTAINVLPMEQYLYGVVPLEMSPSFPIEALKAQVVAARTFASYTRSYGRHTTWLDVCDSSACCQAYRGVAREHDITTQAVRDTSGLKMFSPGSSSPLFTPYSASSGGATINSENVWWAALSHLRGVSDHYEQNARVWTRTFTWAQLTAAVAAQASNANIGMVTSVTVAHSPLGPVHAMTFTGTNGQWTARGEAVRLMFRHVGGSLYSQNFQLEGGNVTGQAASDVINVTVTNGIFNHQTQVNNLYVVNHTGLVTRVNNPYIYNGLLARPTTISVPSEVTITGGTGITLNGRGWGHGVGMSQQGARGMAEAGHCFRTILMHYYTGVEIR